MSRWTGKESKEWRHLIVGTYGNRCHLCGKPIDLTLMYPKAQRFSIDHLVPRSRGGTNALSNLRPAHLGCNSKRGNQLLTAKNRKPEKWQDFFKQ